MSRTGTNSSRESPSASMRLPSRLGRAIRRGQVPGHNPMSRLRRSLAVSRRTSTRAAPSRSATTGGRPCCSSTPSNGYRRWCRPQRAGHPAAFPPAAARPWPVRPRPSEVVAAVVYLAALELPERVLDAVAGAGHASPRSKSANAPAPRLRRSPHLHGGHAPRRGNDLYSLLTGQRRFLTHLMRASHLRHQAAQAQKDSRAPPTISVLSCYAFSASSSRASVSSSMFATAMFSSR
jgi:hypothetical protein